MKTSDDNTVKTLIGGNFSIAVNGHGSFGGTDSSWAFASDSDGRHKLQLKVERFGIMKNYNKIFAQSAMELNKEKEKN